MLILLHFRFHFHLHSHSLLHLNVQARWLVDTNLPSHTSAHNKAHYLPTKTSPPVQTRGSFTLPALHLKKLQEDAGSGTATLGKHSLLGPPTGRLAFVRARQQSPNIHSHADIPEVAKLGKRKASDEHIRPEKRVMTVRESCLVSHHRTNTTSLCPPVTSPTITLVTDLIFNVLPSEPFVPHRSTPALLIILLITSFFRTARWTLIILTR